MITDGAKRTEVKFSNIVIERARLLAGLKAFGHFYNIQPRIYCVEPIRIDRNRLCELNPDEYSSCIDRRDWLDSRHEFMDNAIAFNALTVVYRPTILRD